MNGEVFSFDPRKFYTAEEFNKLSEEFKVKWLNSIMNRYGVGLATISKDVLGKSKGFLLEQAKRKGYLQYLNNPKKGDSLKKSDIGRLQADVRAARGIKTAYTEQMDGFIGKLMEQNANWSLDKEPEVKQEETPEAENPEKEKPTVKADVNNLAVLLSTLMGTGAKLTIELTL